MEIVLFIAFKFLAILCALLVVNVRNPVHAVLLLILVFANAAGILLLLGLEFLAFCYLIVYVGAIAVLFLFVVMVLNIKLIELTSSELNYLPLNAFVTIALGIELSTLAYATFQPSLNFSLMTYISYIKYLDSFSNTELLGQALFLFYPFPFIMVAFVLLIAMIGAILLTLSHQSNVKRQVLLFQHSQTVSHNLRII